MFVPEKVGDKAGKIGLTVFFFFGVKKDQSLEKHFCRCFLSFPAVEAKCEKRVTS